MAAPYQTTRKDHTKNQEDSRSGIGYEDAYQENDGYGFSATASLKGITHTIESYEYVIANHPDATFNWLYEKPEPLNEYRVKNLKENNELIINFKRVSNLNHPWIFVIMTIENSTFYGYIHHEIIHNKIEGKNRHFQQTLSQEKDSNVLQKTDNPQALLINQKLKNKADLFEREMEMKEMLRAIAVEIIEELKAGNADEGTSIIEGDESMLPHMIKAGSTAMRAKTEANAKPGEGFMEREDALEKKVSERIAKERQILDEKTIVTTNKGNNYASNRRNPKTGKPSNLGFIKNGELETSRGIIPSNKIINRLQKVKKGLSLFKFIRTAPVGSLFSAVDLARAFAGLMPLEELSPLSFIDNDIMPELEEGVLNGRIKQGFEATYDFVENMGKDYLKFIFVRELDLSKILTNDIQSISQLDKSSDYSHQDESNPFAVLTSKESDKIEAIVIFYNQNGFR